MISFKTIGNSAAALSLTLLATGFAHAQGSASTTGSTDIYSTDFQKTFATANSISAASSTTLAGSTDIYRTDFQKAFASDPAANKAPSMISGSVDIYTTDFQMKFL